MLLAGDQLCDDVLSTLAVATRCADACLLCCCPLPSPLFSIHTRSLRFPDSCDMSKVDAKFKDGSACPRCASQAQDACPCATRAALTQR
jgi:hypothetical protein